jgi:hypothetical protein
MSFSRAVAARAAVLLLFSPLVPATAGATEPTTGARFVLSANPTEAAKLARRIPSYARQTHLACSACHYQFPQLTPFGRTFKLNGYTLSGLADISQKDSAERQTLKLSPISPVAAMLVVSSTRTAAAVPGTSNGDVLFPDQLSIFYAGELTPKVGAFIQLTYSAPDGAIGIDNAEVRFADRTKLADRSLVYGLSLENNPTVQDPWNTVPAWGYPFMSSPSAPTPMAATVIDGGLSQQVAGLGAYGFWNNLIYAEFTAYARAPQGVAYPLDSTVTGVLNGFTPYWRLAVQHAWTNDYLEVGTFGMQSHLLPTGFSGPANTYTDVALDAQYEHKMGSGVLIGRATWIHESQSLDASYASGNASTASNTLQSWKVNASYDPSTTLGFTLGVFGTTGTTDPLLYPAGDVYGSGTGSPNSSGFIGEFNFNPWQNTRLAIQYTGYSKFNGGTSGYDGTTTRTAQNNNTTYIYLWVAF